MDKYSDIAVCGKDSDKPLNVARRLAVIRPYLDRHSAALLDCGCGAGGYLPHLNAMEGVHAHGLEYEQYKVALAIEQGIPESQITCGDIQSMPFESGCFDAVLLNEVLEHVPDHNAGLREVHRVLKPGGMLLVFSPNRRYPFETHGVVSKRSGKTLMHYVPFIPWVPVSAGQKLWTYQARNYWPGELRRLLKSHGFTSEGVDYVWQTFENSSGRQPAWMKPVAGLLRKTSFVLERTPLLRSMGVSQFLAMRKEESNHG